MSLFLVGCASPQPIAHPALGEDVIQVTPTATMSSGLSLFPTPDLSSPDPLLNEMRNYTEFRKAVLLGEPGWLYLFTKHARSGSRDLSLWDLHPGQYAQEEWLYLEEQGKITRAIRRVTDHTGQIIQVSILADGIWKDLTLGSESLADSGQVYDPGFGFYQQAIQLVKQGRQINKQTLYQDCWYIGEKYMIVDDGILHEAVFDPPTGELRSIKNWEVSSGNIQLIDSMEVAIEKRVPSPPDDVLQLIDASY